MSKREGQPERIENIDRIAGRMSPAVSPTRLDVWAQRDTACTAGALPHLDDGAEPRLRHELRPVLEPDSWRRRGVCHTGADRQVGREASPAVEDSQQLERACAETAVSRAHPVSEACVIQIELGAPVGREAGADIESIESGTTVPAPGLVGRDTAKGGTHVPAGGVIRGERGERGAQQ